jgi:hypothetical protein
MDGSHFDTLTKTLAAAGSRRFALRGLLAGVLALLGGQEVAAKKCKQKDKKKRRKCRKKASQTTTVPPVTIPTGGTIVVPPPPAPPPVTCSDGIQNGSESDVDCGGPECDRCTIGLGCLGPADCSTSHCVDNVCRTCSAPCSSECACIDGACISMTRVVRTICADCPRYSYCNGSTPTVSCWLPCA